MRVVSTGNDTAVFERESVDGSVGSEVVEGAGDHDDTEDRDETEDLEVDLEVEKGILEIESDREALLLLEEECRVELDDDEWLPDVEDEWLDDDNGSV